jgi:hypothetical protein
VGQNLWDTLQACAGQGLCTAGGKPLVCSLQSAVNLRAPPQLVAVSQNIAELGKANVCANAGGTWLSYRSALNVTYHVSVYSPGPAGSASSLSSCPLDYLQSMPAGACCQSTPSSMCWASAPPGALAPPPSVHAAEQFVSAAPPTASAVPVQLPAQTLLYKQAGLPFAQQALMLATQAGRQVINVVAVTATLDSAQPQAQIVTAFADALAADASVATVFIQSENCTSVAASLGGVQVCTIVAAAAGTSNLAMFYVTNSPVFKVSSLDQSQGLIIMAAQPGQPPQTAVAPSRAPAINLHVGGTPVYVLQASQPPAASSNVSAVGWAFFALLCVLVFILVASAAPMMWYPSAQSGSQKNK